MKKKTIGDLLKKLEEAHVTNNDNISNLNDAISKKLLKGGYNTNNGFCNDSTNLSCQNDFCTGSNNTFCHNTSCLV